MEHRQSYRVLVQKVWKQADVGSYSARTRTRTVYSWPLKHSNGLERRLPCLTSASETVSAGGTTSRCLDPLVKPQIRGGWRGGVGGGVRHFALFRRVCTWPIM